MKKIIVFTGTTCPPCKLYKNELNKNNIIYTEKNIDNNADLNFALSYGVSSTPTTIIFNKDDSIQDVVIGFRPYAMIKELI